MVTSWKDDHLQVQFSTILFVICPWCPAPGIYERTNLTSKWAQFLTNMTDEDSWFTVQSKPLNKKQLKSETKAYFQFTSRNSSFWLAKGHTHLRRRHTVLAICVVWPGSQHWLPATFRLMLHHVSVVLWLKIMASQRTVLSKLALVCQWTNAS